MNVKNLITKSAIFAALMSVSVSTANAVQSNTAKAAQITLNYKNNGYDTSDSGSKALVGKASIKSMFAKEKNTIKVHKTHWYKHPYSKIALNPYQISYEYMNGKFKLVTNTFSHDYNNNYDNNMGPDKYIINGYTFDQKGNKYYISTYNVDNNKKGFNENTILLSTSFFKAPQVYQLTKTTNFLENYYTDYDDNEISRIMTDAYTSTSDKYDFAFAPKRQSNTFLLTNTTAKFNKNTYKLIWKTINTNKDDDMYARVTTFWINAKDLKTHAKKGGTFTLFEPDWNDNGDIVPTIKDTYTNKNIKKKITKKVSKSDPMYY